MTFSALAASDEGGEAVRATVQSPGRSIGSTAIPVNATTHWPTGAFIATSGQLLSTGLLNPTTVQVFYGTASGTTITITSFAAGYSDIGNSVGDVVVIKPSTEGQDNLVRTLAIAHNNDGTLKNGSITPNNLSLSIATSAIIGTGGHNGFAAPGLTIFDSTECPPVTLTIPSGYKVLYWGSVRLIAGDVGYYDCIAQTMVDGSGTLPAGSSNSQFFFTSNNTQGDGAAVAIAGSISGLSAGSHTFSFGGYTSAGQSMNIGPVFCMFMVVAN